MGDAGDANQRWAEMLARWAIPEDLVLAAPASPYFFDPDVFIVAADEALARGEDSPSDAAARDALPPDGTVLDVGVGAGAGSLRLADRAGNLVGVDSNSELLAAFAARATRLAVNHATVEGRWPEVASAAPAAHVVVCHHVLYNVSDLVGFAAALSAHATRRVVLELTTVHPMTWMSRYWQAVHGLTQPDRPSVDDALDVFTAMGFDVQQERWQRRIQMIGECDEGGITRIARRLCLPAARHGELQRLLAATPPPEVRDVATIWWSR